jgi:chromosome segregation ATPase
LTEHRKTPADVEKLISESENAIAELKASNARLQTTIDGIEQKITEDTEQRDRLELYEATAVDGLGVGIITLEQLSENGQAIDRLTAEIDRLEDLHGTITARIRGNDEKLYDFGKQLRNRQEMRFTLEAETLAEQIIKKSGDEIRRLLVLTGRASGQPSSPFMGTLIADALKGFAQHE